MRVLHVISGLGVGGAEMMLYKLLRARANFDDAHEVLCLQRDGAMSERIAALGVAVQTIGLNRAMDLPRALWALTGAARRRPHDLVQGWMYHGNCAASLVGKLSRKQVVWNVRQSLASMPTEKRATTHVIKLSARISRHVDTTIYNSATARADHHRVGFSAHRDILIDNGFDLAQFAPDTESRRRVRASLNIASNVLVVGLIARFHPMKDHAGFLRAAARFNAQGIPVHYVLAGTGVNDSNAALMADVRANGLANHVSLLGVRNDIPAILSSLDIATSSSAHSEGFANVIGEAMACAVPCVVTDVGDSARIVGDTGRIVPPSDPDALAAAWHDLATLGALEREHLGRLARVRVTGLFSIDAIAESYIALYRRRLQSRQPAGSTA